METFPTLKIIPAIPLLRFEKEPSGLPFAYSLYDLLFLICPKMARDLLETIQAKNLHFPTQVSQCHITL